MWLICHRHFLFTICMWLVYRSFWPPSLTSSYLRFFFEQRKSRSSSFSLQTSFRQNASTLILGIQSLPVHECSSKIFLWPLIGNRSFLHICGDRAEG